MSLPPELQAAATRLGLRIESVLRRTDKTLLVTGTLAGRPVAVKCLLSDDPFWIDRWRHEVAVYQLFVESPPPISVPKLVYTDGARLLVLEWLDGHHLDDDRYPQRTLTPDEIGGTLACVSALNGWPGPVERFDAFFDYANRFDRYHAYGYLTDGDREALAVLLARCGPARQINHGDPVPGNILLQGNHDVTLLDWEFTGLYLPGFDLAVLHTLLGAHTPTIRARIDAAVADSDIEEDAFTVNLVAVLTRELRLHRELPDSLIRQARLPLIEAAWRRAQERLHRRCTPST